MSPQSRPGVVPLHALVSDGRPTAGSLLAALEDAAAIVDGAGRVLEWNDAAVRRFGLGPEEVTGRPLAELGLAEPADPASAVRLSLGSQAGPGTLIVWRPTQDSLPPEAPQLQKAQALGWLAGPVQHELNNRLGAIFSLSALVGDDPRVPEDLQSLAVLLRDEAERTLRISRSLLELVRTRGAEPGPVRLGPLVRGIVELEAGTLTRTETFVQVPDSLPEVHADPARLRQIVLALTVNAILALGGRDARGRFAVTASLVGDPDASVVRLVVEDSAPVVPEAEREALFAVYPEPGPCLRRNGLDLAVAARLAAIDHGSLRYEPMLEGNRFVLDLLPATRAASATVNSARAAGAGVVLPAAAGEGPTRGASPGTATAGAVDAPLIVLVCDDDASIRALIHRILERSGLQTIEVSSAEEALGVLRQTPVSAVLADQRMSKMTGTELYQRAIEIQPGLRARFMFMSGDAGDAELTAFARAAGLRILPKPFDMKSLPDAVRGVAGG